MSQYAAHGTTIGTTAATPDANAPAGPLPGAQLVSRLGHDLRGPLGGILGVTRLLLAALAAGPVDPGLLVHRLELVRTSGERLLRTLDRLIEVAGIETAAPRPRVPFDCRPVTAALLPTDETGRPRLVAELPDRPVLVLGDEDLLGRLLRELLDNARTAAEGEVRLRVHPPAAGLVRIEVADDGAGLGLYLVRLLADRLGAELGVRSEAGRGTTVTLEVPAAPPG